MPDEPFRSRMNDGAARALRLVAGGARGVLINNHVQNAQQIRTQVHTLAPFFEFIAYDDLKERLHSGSDEKPFCLMTFDDGAAINAEATAPELLRLGVPAAFYIVPGSMDVEQAPWFDRLAAVQCAAGAEPLPSLAAFKAMPWRERDQRLDELCNSFGVDADLTDPAVRAMSWADAVRLQREGFEIGSHTLNHAILTVETAEEAQRQIEESMREMARHGLPTCRTFAFPNGNASRALVEAALNAGLESTMTTAPAWVRKRDTISCLPRLFLKERADPLYIHTKVLLARSGWLLKNTNGNGRRYCFGPS